MEMNSAQTRKLQRGLLRLEHTVLMPGNAAVKVEKAKKWCNETFGKQWNVIDHKGGRWTVFWTGPNEANSYLWRFAKEQDKLMFILKWV